LSIVSCVLLFRIIFLFETNFLGMAGLITESDFLALAGGLLFIFFIFAIVYQPRLVVEDCFSISPDNVVRVGDLVTIALSVRNDGFSTGNFTLTLRLNETIVASKSITLHGWSSSVVEFTFRPFEVGNFIVSVDGFRLFVLTVLPSSGG